MHQNKNNERRKRELTNVLEHMAAENLHNHFRIVSLVFVVIWFHALSTLLQNL
jgi:hypothetical protein